MHIIGENGRENGNGSYYMIIGYIYIYKKGVAGNKGAYSTVNM